RERLALRPIAVALRHERGRGGQRKPGETAVLADRVEMGGVGTVSAFCEDPLDRDLHAGVILTLVRWQPRVDLEPLVLPGDEVADLGVGDVGHGPPQVAWSD